MMDKTSILSFAPQTKNFPSDVFKWLKKNANPKSSFKLMQICKYFQYPKFTVTLVEQISYNDYNNLYFYYYKGGYSGRHFESLPNNLWLTNNLKDDVGFKISPLLRKVVYCDIKILNLSAQEITYNEFKFITAAGKITQCTFLCTTVKYGNNEVVPLEAILGHLPNAESISITGKVPPWLSNESKKLIPKIQRLSLSSITTGFSIESFSTLMINNQKTNFHLALSFDNPEEHTEYIQRIENCVYKIVKQWSSENMPPKFVYTGQSEESKQALINLYEIHIRQKLENIKI